MRISEQTAAFAVYLINWLVFIAVLESVYSAVRTICLYKADYVRSLGRLKINYKDYVKLYIYAAAVDNQLPC